MDTASPPRIVIGYAYWSSCFTCSTGSGSSQFLQANLGVVCDILVLVIRELVIPDGWRPDEFLYTSRPHLSIFKYPSPKWTCMHFVYIIHMYEWCQILLIIAVVVCDRLLRGGQLREWNRCLHVHAEIPLIISWVDTLIWIYLDCYFFNTKHVSAILLSNS
jgi:hypothetical protein